MSSTFFAILKFFYCWKYFEIFIKFHLLINWDLYTANSNTIALSVRTALIWWLFAILSYYKLHLCFKNFVILGKVEPLTHTNPRDGKESLYNPPMFARTSPDPSALVAQNTLLSQLYSIFKNFTSPCQTHTHPIRWYRHRLILIFFLVAALTPLIFAPIPRIDCCFLAELWILQFFSKTDQSVFRPKHHESNMLICSFLYGTLLSSPLTNHINMAAQSRS